MHAMFRRKRTLRSNSVSYTVLCREQNTETAMRKVLRTMRCRNAGAFRIIKIDKREKEITR